MGVVGMVGGGVGSGVFGVFASQRPLKAWCVGAAKRTEIGLALTHSGNGILYSPCQVYAVHADAAAPHDRVHQVTPQGTR